jgi:ribosomal protein S18 acetylase RimI-like enzyme
MKTGRIYKRFKTSNRESVTLRALKWEDLNNCVSFINELVAERDTEPNLGILADKKQTREEEAEWLAHQLTGIENGSIISVAAETGGRIVGNGSVTRGSYNDTKHHGYLGIAISRNHRDRRIGVAMMRALVAESKKAGLKTIELEVFANNPRAIHVYNGTGFKEAGRIPKKIWRKGKSIDAIIMAAEL